MRVWCNVCEQPRLWNHKRDGYLRRLQCACGAVGDFEREPGLPMAAGARRAPALVPITVKPLRALPSPRIRDGLCRACQCTEGHACRRGMFGTCAWSDDSRTLCSFCAPLEREVQALEAAKILSGPGGAA